MLSDRNKERMIPTGCRGLDRLLGGGLPEQVITQFYGEPGSGKTSVCLQTVKSNPGKRIVFVDTESSFHPIRVDQVLAGLDRNVLRNVRVFRVTDFSEQTEVLNSLPDCDLVIVDSISSLYRLQRADDGLEASRVLGNQVASLLAFARKNNIPVLVTNQVYTDPETGRLEPVGGDVLRYASKIIVELRREEGAMRRAFLRKHFSRPDGQDTLFRIVGTGVI